MLSVATMQFLRTDPLLSDVLAGLTAFGVCVCVCEKKTECLTRREGLAYQNKSEAVSKIGVSSPVV